MNRVLLPILRYLNRRHLILFSYVVIVVVVSIGYFNIGRANYLDWYDWLFWARQNYQQILQSKTLFDPVISPVQGLYGLSYPVNPIFNPLWWIAVHIQDPVESYRVSYSLSFCTIAIAIWITIGCHVRHPFLRLISSIFCLNLFFDLVPFGHVLPFPKSTFGIIYLMPPQNFLFLTAMLCYVLARKSIPIIPKVLGTTILTILSILSDPFYFTIFFFPVFLFICGYYLANLQAYYKEIIVYSVLLVVLYISGILEYPWLLQENIARSVFNSDLFVNHKTAGASSLAFQKPQNLFFMIPIFFILLYWSIKTYRPSYLIALLILSLSIAMGLIMGVSDMNLNFAPRLSYVEVTAYPIIMAILCSGVEREIAATNPRRVVFIVISAALVSLVLASSVKDIAYGLRNLDNPYTKVPLLLPEQARQNEIKGSVSFLIGQKNSKLSQLQNFFDAKKFNKELISFLQHNDDDEGFYAHYQKSIALISYWYSGIKTLEENNHLTNPFYNYFFRNLFMEENDYYSVNWNLFRRAQEHLYPLLGVEYLISDEPLDYSEKFVLDKYFNDQETEFWISHFSDHNSGQYSPSILRYFDNARDMEKILSSKTFDPKTLALLHNKDFISHSLEKADHGEIHYENNSIRFIGLTSNMSMNILPVLFSNCLVSEQGNTLLRVNLILTGIVYEGQVNDTIRYRGPPFSNQCLSKDIQDIAHFKLLDRRYPYPKEYDQPTLNLPSWPFWSSR